MANHSLVIVKSQNLFKHFLQEMEVFPEKFYSNGMGRKKQLKEGIISEFSGKQFPSYREISESFRAFSSRNGRFRKNFFKMELKKEAVKRGRHLRILGAVILTSEREIEKMGTGNGSPPSVSGKALSKSF
ncbi:hypothetical protein CEXT_492451 [Caerostris extrusa]|uniref:Uncharacterized protein n=1 Tax=Caerostris extrusa TaxID=172846 RepID=A0AAV4NZU7_CAEEX|nr:hypothetical protein CEXT_492451 [Caerostris extrusa]